MRTMPLAFLTLQAIAGCAPGLDDDTPYVTDLRVLAARIEPPEVEPGGAVTLTALVADPGGALDAAPTEWAFCLAPKPLAELGPVSPACLEPDSEDLVFVGEGSPIEATVPADACSLFGPNPPLPREGEPPGRPVDPDATGGFHQPLVSWLQDASPTLAAVRIRCGIANVSQETFIAWNQGYLSNLNPEVAALSLERGGDAVDVPRDGEGEPPVVAPGEEVTLTVRWPDCPAPDAGAPPEACGGAETYVVFDPATGRLGNRREAVSATWFTTGGTFGVARNGRDGSDAASWVGNAFTAPEDEGEVWIGVVLRDERGGVDFAGYRLLVGR